MGLKEGGARGSLRNIGTGVSAIPDSGMLYARWDFSEEDGSLPVTDQSGNGHDLDTGGYTGVGVTINGVQAGEFDGVDDYVEGDLTVEGQPNTVFVVLESDVAPPDIYAVYEGAGSNGHQIDVNSDGSYNLQNDGANVNDIRNSPHIITAHHAQTNAELRINGVTEDAPSDGALQDESIDVWTLANQGFNDTRFLEVNIGEVLIYPDGDKSRIPDVEQYLSDKWGIAI